MNEIGGGCQRRHQQQQQQKQQQQQQQQQQEEKDSLLQKWEQKDFLFLIALLFLYRFLYLIAKMCARDLTIESDI